MIDKVLAMTFPLTYLCLRFRCQAVTPLYLGRLQAGSYLRGALVEVMRRATCTESLPGWRRKPDPEHAAHCPVCWLVAADDHPGQERRGYTLTPPVRVAESLPLGEQFVFHITLFGNAGRYLPYFVLAVPEAGRCGVGPGRGTFALKSIHAEHLLSGDWEVLKEGENLVRPPDTPVSHADVLQASETYASLLSGHKSRLRLDYLTPLRLILDGSLLKSPDFGVLFSHILKRLDDLSIQYAGGVERDPEDRRRLWRLADQVRLVEDQTHWEEVRSGSSRSGKTTWISGLVGTAYYHAKIDVWRELLPWLLWGEVAQVGKDTAKGNGVFRVSVE